MEAIHMSPIPCYLEATLEDELGCLSYCSAFDDNRSIQQESEKAVPQQHQTVEKAEPTPLYFCLSPACMTPSKSASEHKAVCHKLSTTGTLCDNHYLDVMPSVDSPIEEYPEFDAVVNPYSDEEKQILHRSAPLTQSSTSRRCEGRYSTVLWHLSNRPRDSCLALIGLLIAVVASIMLLALISLFAAVLRGDFDKIVTSADAWLSQIQRNLVDFLWAFGDSRQMQSGNPNATGR